MDLDDFRSVLETSGVDLWSFIDAAITVASADHGGELKLRRDSIVERLYALTSVAACPSCDAPGEERVKALSPPQSPEDDEVDPFEALFDDEQKRVLDIKEHLEEPDQSEDTIVDLLQSLADMDITFRALKETDIGRHVNHLRKHPSSDVRRLVKHLVKKWKEIVDEWVKVNQPGESSALMADGDSPQRKIPQNGHHQVPDFAYSPNPNNGSSGSDRNNSEPEPKPKSVPRKVAPPRPAGQSVSASTSASHNRPRDSNIDLDRLASASKRLQANYKDAENAKKQRKIQVMDIHEIPKAKNTFFGKNKGGGSHGKHW